MTRLPYSHDDLFEIARRLKQWEKRLVGPNGYRDASVLVTRIEVHRPEDPGEIIGHFVLVDEWLGFRPLEDSE